MNVADMLDEYHGNLIAIEFIAMDKQRLRDRLLSPEIKEAMADIDAEFDPQINALNERNKALVDTIKGAVLESKATVAGEHNKAVYSHGRVTWDAKGLDGYAVAHPEILVFRKEGEPSVSIR